MKVRNVVGPEIRRLRYARGWSQAKLALKLQLAGWDISRSGVAKIEAQLVWVGDYELYYFTEVFRVTLEALFPKVDPRKPLYQTLAELTQKRPR